MDSPGPTICIFFFRKHGGNIEAYLRFAGGKRLRGPYGSRWEGGARTIALYRNAVVAIPRRVRAR